ncbi:FecR domain-containing protein [Pseudomonas abieticivorans]|uniref:FecR domain-containing protein n=1 Tax=Pseudomonas abieticivorans TaxID=2931382 RepID=UPI0020C0F79D|nr:FecR domain-containing protein [Pseudomonas sp. PIA16]
MKPAIDPQILGEAADFLVQLQSGSATAEDHRAVAQWRGRSAQHALAWQKAEALLGDLRSVPGSIALDTLKRAERSQGVGRRQMLTRLGLLLLAGPLAWAAWRETPWQQWSADAHTATGEQKPLQLPDGSRLLLNTATSVNIAFSDEQRRLTLLNGEILISTAKDPAPAHRPFIVETPQGTAQALGTHFSVRSEGERSRVAVMEGAVRVQPRSGMQDNGATIHAGQQSTFDELRSQPLQALDANAFSWEKGMLVARDMRLADVLSELARYRPGVLRCDPAAAQLRVSGAFSLRDSDASLRLLQDTLPLTINRLTRYWVTVGPRAS